MTYEKTRKTGLRQKCASVRHKQTRSHLFYHTYQCHNARQTAAQKTLSESHSLAPLLNCEWRFTTANSHHRPILITNHRPTLYWKTRINRVQNQSLITGVRMNSFTWFMAFTGFCLAAGAYSSIKIWDNTIKSLEERVATLEKKNTESEFDQRD